MAKSKFRKKITTTLWKISLIQKSLQQENNSTVVCGIVFDKYLQSVSIVWMMKFAILHNLELTPWAHRGLNHIF